MMLSHVGLNCCNTAKLHIITVYYGLSDRNKEWLRLQQEYLKKNTTIPYRFSIYANGCNHQLFSGIDVIGTEPYKHHHQMGINHLECLKKATTHFDKSYEYFLILDSDCFPIMYGWNEILSERMKEHGYQIAAPYRFENLDNFPHPCVMFMSRQGLIDLDLILTGPNDNFLRGMPKDPTCTNQCFPLLRSNRVNVHPIVAGIYYDMFYHHGAGSRNPLFRITDFLNYYKYNNHQEWANRAYDMLIKDSDKFIKMLMSNPCA